MAFNSSSSTVWLGLQRHPSETLGDRPTGSCEIARFAHTKRDSAKGKRPGWPDRASCVHFAGCGRGWQLGPSETLPRGKRLKLVERGKIPGSTDAAATRSWKSSSPLLGTTTSSSASPTDSYGKKTSTTGIPQTDEGPFRPDDGRLLHPGKMPGSTDAAATENPYRVTVWPGQKHKPCEIHLLRGEGYEKVTITHPSSAPCASEQARQ